MFCCLPHLGTVQSGCFAAFRIWERCNPVVLLPSAFGNGAIRLICCIRGARRIKNTRIVDFHDSVLFLLFVFEWVSFVTSGCCCRVVVVVLFVNYGLKIRIILEIINDYKIKIGFKSKRIRYLKQLQRRGALQGRGASRLCKLCRQPRCQLCDWVGRTSLFIICCYKHSNPAG